MSLIHMLEPIKALTNRDPAYLSTTCSIFWNEVILVRTWCIVIPWCVIDWLYTSWAWPDPLSLQPDLSYGTLRSGHAKLWLDQPDSQPAACRGQCAWKTDATCMTLKGQLQAHFMKNLNALRNAAWDPRLCKTTSSSPINAQYIIRCTVLISNIDHMHVHDCTSRCVGLW